MSLHHTIGLLVTGDPEGDRRLETVLDDPYKRGKAAPTLAGSTPLYSSGRLIEVLDRLIARGETRESVGMKAMETVAVQLILGDADWACVEGLRDRLKFFGLDGRGPRILVEYWHVEVIPMVEPIAMESCMSEALTRMGLDEDEGKALLAWAAAGYNEKRKWHSEVPLRALVGAGVPYAHVLDDDKISLAAKDAIRATSAWRRNALGQCAGSAAKGETERAL